MKKDRVSQLIAQWKRVRPDLDAAPMQLSGRLLRIAQLVERRTEAILKPYGLSLWQFDVLATLRRHDQDMSPGQLLAATLLTSGAMTHRLDRLEAAGLIERLPDPDDRRGVRVRLTEDGMRLVDRAIEARFAEATRIQSTVDAEEAEVLARLLATLEHGLSQLDEE